MREIVILARSQFGHQTDYSTYTSLLAQNEYRVTYIGLHVHPQNFSADNVEIHDLVLPRFLPIRLWRYLFDSAKIIYKKKPAFILVQYWPFVLLWTLVLYGYRSKLVLDIRTGSVKKNKPFCTLQNWLIRVNCRFFKHVSCISTSLTERLRLPPHTSLLPLGGTYLQRSNLSFEDGIRFLYIGTFFSRNLDKMLVGFSDFLKHKTEKIRVSMTIVGDGEERLMLESTCRKLGISDFVFFMGYVQHDKLPEILLQHNAGISYIPITPQYDCQPPTKTYEYLLSGMPVLATATKENQRVIRDDNGHLCDDSPEAVAEGFRQFMERLPSFSLDGIYRSVEQYDWNHIVQQHMRHLIDKVASE